MYGHPLMVLAHAASLAPSYRVFAAWYQASAVQGDLFALHQVQGDSGELHLVQGDSGELHLVQGDSGERHLGQADLIGMVPGVGAPSALSGVPSRSGASDRTCSVSTTASNSHRRESE